MTEPDGVVFDTESVSTEPMREDALHTIDSERLRAALYAVAEHRQHAVEPLSQALTDLPDRQQSYDALRVRASFARVPPERWSELLTDVVAFVDPLISHEEHSPTWDPATCGWR